MGLNSRACISCPLSGAEDRKTGLFTRSAEGGLEFHGIPCKDPQLHVLHTETSCLTLNTFLLVR